MFTGLIQDIGTVRSVTQDGERRVTIATALDTEAMTPGASVACDGCCLTVVEKGPDWFAVEVSQESLDKTTLGRWQAGTKINLEPSLKLGDDLGGHFVFGHVDGRAVLERCEPAGESRRLTLGAPADLMAYIAPKGSVALNGVSLTVNAVEDTQFQVNIIPHSWAQTALSALAPGDALNLEIDMLARYVARMLNKEAA